MIFGVPGSSQVIFCAQNLSAFRPGKGDAPAGLGARRECVDETEISQKRSHRIGFCSRLV